MNPLTDIIPSRYRRYVYAAVALGSLVFGAWEASGHNWSAMAASLVAIVGSALAHANTAAIPPAVEAAQPSAPAKDAAPPA